MRQRSIATRREIWLAATLLLILVIPLLVQQDVGTHPSTRRSTSGITMRLPPASGDAAVLLNNTPLAITPSDALALNAARPLDATPTNFARPFFLPAKTAVQPSGTNAALDCLTQAVYYEAASESDMGERAVAQVVLNRMRSPIFPHTICGVVYEGSQQRTGCQFSFTCDGSLARQPSVAGWARARRIALAALSGSIERSVGLSTHYHANYVVPYWATSLDKVATIGAHIFYTMRGSLGRPPGFGASYNASAEAPPNLTALTDPNADPDAALLNGMDAETIDPTKIPVPNRTVVKDDSLGAPNRPDRVVAPPSPLRADEARGELVVDKNKGVLTNSR